MKFDVRVSYEKMRTYHDLTGGPSEVAEQLAAMRERLERRLATVRHSVAVMSGKGGVGKSVVSANLAAALAAQGLAVGVADADLNGPSMARLLGAKVGPPRITERGVEPAVGAAGVRVMSMDLWLERDETPVRWVGPESDTWVWRGAAEASALREFLGDTVWGELDYLILDLPPGADRLGTVRDLVPGLGGVIAVTIPSGLSRFVVGKSLSMARDLGVPVLGYVLNMAAYGCPHCGETGPLFGTDVSFDGVDRLAEVPFDPELGRLADAGRTCVLERPGSGAGLEFRALADRVRAFFESDGR